MADLATFSDTGSGELAVQLGRFQRAVGLIVLATATGAAALLWCAITVGEPTTTIAPTEGEVFGFWTFLYDVRLPEPSIMLAAVALALLFAAGLAWAEECTSTRSRRSEDRQARPLAPRLVMGRTRGVFAGPVTVTVLIPAHNEAGTLAGTLASLLFQSRPPERVVVVADNCTDGTAEIARNAGVEVFETVGNTEKKAGALNQALERLIDHQGHNDLVMVMDADTILDDGFLEAAVARFTADRALMAVGGLFYGEEGAGLLGQFQRNEYIRYAREIRRRRGRVFVLTGTASIFRPMALRTVAARRGRSLPGRPGYVYDTAALTEDNELTIALKSLGGLMMSPGQCTVVTEVMPTWRALWAQRLRWQRGALENLGAYGISSQTFRYWAQQFGIGYGVIALGAYFLLTLLMALSLNSWVWLPFWLGLGLVFVLERVATVWRGGWRARLVALLLLPELVYAAFLSAVFVKGVLDICFGRSAGWQHVVRTGDPELETVG